MMAESRRLFVTDTPQRFNITPDVHKPDDITACPVEDALWNAFIGFNFSNKPPV